MSNHNKQGKQTILSNSCGQVLDRGLGEEFIRVEGFLRKMENFKYPHLLYSMMFETPF